MEGDQPTHVSHSIDHPTWTDIRRLVQRSRSLVSQTSVSLLLKSKGLECVSVVPHKEKDSLNSVYMIYTRPIRDHGHGHDGSVDLSSLSSSSSSSSLAPQATSLHKRTSSYFRRHESRPDLVLRLVHPHQWWATRLTLNEVLMLHVIRTHTKITVPDVIAWSCDAHSSPFKAEYVLMTHLPGVAASKMLANKWPVGSPKRLDYIRRLADVVKELRTRIPKAPRIGSLTLSPMSGPAAAAFSGVELKRSADSPITTTASSIVRSTSGEVEGQPHGQSSNKDIISSHTSTPAGLVSVPTPPTPSVVSLREIGTGGIEYPGLLPVADIGDAFPGTWRIAVGGLVQSGPTLGAHESLFHQALANIDWCLASLVICQPNIYRALAPSIQRWRKKLVRYYNALKNEAQVRAARSGDTSGGVTDHQLLTTDFFVTHFDLNDHNVFVEETDGEVRITGIAGWDKSHTAPKWEDHANLVFGLDTPNEGEQGEVVEALRRYGHLQPTGYEWARQIQLILMVLNGMCFFTASDIEFRNMRVTHNVDYVRPDSEYDEDLDEVYDDNDDDDNDTLEGKDNAMPTTPVLRSQNPPTAAAHVDDIILSPGDTNTTSSTTSLTTPMSPSFAGRTNAQLADLRRQATIIRETHMLVELFKSTECWEPVPEHPLPPVPKFTKSRKQQQQQQGEQMLKETHDTNGTTTA